ncbi:MAG TPA: hypothetical protein VGJ13_13725 [Pseudonocardiaceae bacterium]|jgi:hypothetical protein
MAVDHPSHGLGGGAARGAVGHTIGPAAGYVTAAALIGLGISISMDELAIGFSLGLSSSFLLAGIRAYS